MVLATLVTVKRNTYDKESASNAVLTIEDDYIKWVDFTVSYEATSFITITAHLQLKYSLASISLNLPVQSGRMYHPTVEEI